MKPGWVVMLSDLGPAFDVFVRACSVGHRRRFVVVIWGAFWVVVPLTVRRCWFAHREGANA